MIVRRLKADFSNHGKVKYAHCYTITFNRPNMFGYREI